MIPLVLFIFSFSETGVQEIAFTDEIVVAGEAVRETATVALVTSEEIEQRGLRTVAEALELVPGAVVRLGEKGESYVQLRGFRQQEIAVLIDGVPSASPFDGVLDLDNLPVEMIDRIEVVKGASSVLYGANAMGGVVNIVTRKSNGEFDGAAEVGTGSGHGRDFSAWGQGQWARTRVSVGATHVDREDFPLPGDYPRQANQDPGARDNSDRLTTSGRVNLGWDVGESMRLAVNLRVIDLKKGIPHHESDAWARYWRFDDWRHSEINAVLDGHFGPASFKAKVYTTTLSNVLDSYDDRTYSTQDGNRAFQSTYDDDAIGGDAFFRFVIGDAHLLKTGLRARRDVHRQQSDADQPWERLDAETFSVPLEGEWTPGEMWSVTYGAAFDAMRFDHPQHSRKQMRTSLSPQIAARLTPPNDWEFRFSLSQKNRFPTLEELFVSPSGNPDLEPMNSKNIELGVCRQIRPNLNVDWVAFYSEVDDLIDRENRHAPFFNVDRAVFKGIETGVRWVPGTHFTLAAAYTYLNARDVSPDSPKYMEHRPEHKLDLVVAWHPIEALELNLMGSHVSDQRYFDNEETRMLDACTLIDLRLAYRFKRQIEASALVKNLGDALAYEDEGFPLAGRRVHLAIKWRY